MKNIIILLRILLSEEELLARVCRKRLLSRSIWGPKIDDSLNYVTCRRRVDKDWLNWEGRTTWPITRRRERVNNSLAIVGLRLFSFYFNIDERHLKMKRCTQSYFLFAAFYSRLKIYDKIKYRIYNCGMPLCYDWYS